MNIAEVLSNKDTRIHACRESKYLFAIYYFSHYFHLPSAPFHPDMYKDLNFDGYRFLLWIMFRESAKTVLARIDICHNICYGLSNNITWVGHDKHKAAKNIRAIANELQANPLLIEDFGQLYYEPIKRETMQKQRSKTMFSFRTANDINVSAVSTNVSLRGMLEGEHRPDYYVIDDIENSITKKSPVKTAGIISFLDELLTGVAASCKILILANRITNRGVVSFLENKSRGKNWKKREVALYDKERNITWPARFVQTEAEAKERNKGKPKKSWCVSIESLLEDIGTASFAQEYLNQPQKDGSSIVREEWFNEKSFYDMSQLHLDEQGKYWFTPSGIDAQAAQLTVYLAADPAVSTKETADDRSITAIGTCSIRVGDKSIRYFVILESRHGRWPLSEFARILASMRDKHKSSSIGVESNGVQELFRVAFQEYGISTKALKPDGDKVRRLNRHVADIEFQRVLFPANDSCEDLRQELVMFTGAKDDLDNQVDSFTYAMDMAKGTGTGFTMEALN